VHGESGQGTVEWVALVLLAALVLGAGAAFAARESERGLGEVVAKRIARGPSGLDLAGRAAAAPAPPTPRAPGSLAPRAPASLAPGARARATPRASAPRAPASGAADDLRGIRGIGSVARHAWIGCLGYQRWRYERENPIAAIEGLPVGEALGIVNDCLNPHSYLLED
jgi:predicted flap endonuclease-1-like 5' DNA nuclease